MENKQLDQLFQKKLDGFEAPVSPAAWDQIAQQMGPKEEKTKRIWWYVAASVAACLAVVVLWQSPDEVTVDSVLADHPVWEPNDWRLEPLDVQPIPLDGKSVTDGPAETSNSASTKGTYRAMVTEPTEPDLSNPPQAMELVVPDRQVTTPSLAVTNPDVTLTPVEAKKEVKIIYVANATAEEEKGLKRIWAKAQQVDPVGLLASVREKKDEFFRFKGKNN